MLNVTDWAPGQTELCTRQNHFWPTTQYFKENNNFENTKKNRRLQSSSKMSLTYLFCYTLPTFLPTHSKYMFL